MSTQPKTREKSPEQGEEQPTAQGEQHQIKWRDRLPDWVKELPYLTVIAEEPDKKYRLIRSEELEKTLAEHGVAADSEAAKRIREDIAFMDDELLRLFRDRDHNAKLQQKRYRSIQIGFTLLSMLAAIFGSLQSLALASYPQYIPWIAFAETAVALLAVYLAQISGREPPLPAWLQDRRRAEQMRREHFHFLLNLPPYDQLDDISRRLTLSERAAEINRGVFPEEAALR